MQDVVGTMAEDELIEWKVDRIISYLMLTPAIESGMSESDWRSLHA